MPLDNRVVDRVIVVDVVSVAGHPPKLRKCKNLGLATDPDWCGGGIRAPVYRYI